MKIGHCIAKASDGVEPPFDGNRETTDTRRF
jgi:hypothetical protein